VWNGTVNSAVMDGDDRLARRVSLTVDGLDGGRRTAALARVDAEHSNIKALCPDDVIWPDAATWQRLHEADRLHEEHLPDVHPDTTGVGVTFDFELPQPGVVRIRLAPARDAAGTDDGSAR
jgi:hypothetical protein